MTAFLLAVATDPFWQQLVIVAVPSVLTIAGALGAALVGAKKVKQHIDESNGEDH